MKGLGRRVGDRKAEEEPVAALLVSGKGYRAGGVGGSLSARMAATMPGVLVVIVAWMVTWFISLL